jgi:hypothetical protein
MRVCSIRGAFVSARGSSGGRDWWCRYTNTASDLEVLSSWYSRCHHPKVYYNEIICVRVVSSAALSFALLEIKVRGWSVHMITRDTKGC